MTLMMIFVACVFGTVVVTEPMKQLAYDVRLAMQRCGLTVDWVAGLIETPPNKLSLQLNGYLPFTLLCRFADLRLEAVGFWHEFHQIRVERAGLMVMPRDMSRYLARVEDVFDLVAGRAKKECA